MAGDLGGGALEARAAAGNLELSARDYYRLALFRVEGDRGVAYCRTEEESRGCGYRSAQCGAGTRQQQRS